MLNSDTSNDRHLEQTIWNRLAPRHVVGRHGLRVAVNAGEVTLSGYVHSFYERQLCTHAAMGIEGVRRLIDRLHVLDARR